MANRILDALEAAELVAKGEADLWEARRFREAADGMEALAKKHEKKRQWADQMKMKIRALADTI